MVVQRLLLGGSSHVLLFFLLLPSFLKFDGFAQIKRRLGLRFDQLQLLRLLLVLLYIFNLFQRVGDALLDLFFYFWVKFPMRI